MKNKLVLTVLLVAILFFGFLQSINAVTLGLPGAQATPVPFITPKATLQPAATMSPVVEHALIDQWIKKNNLNTNGDPQDTMYTGGSPLFDETTGKTIDRYTYIKNKHPDKPWNK